MECYRLFRPLIEKYIALFELAETEWVVKCMENKYFTQDYFFVSSLPTHEIRVFFWLDKIEMFESQQFANALQNLQSTYIVHSFWRLPPYIHSREEAELFYLLNLLFTDNTICEYVPFFAFCVRNYYRAIDF